MKALLIGERYKEKLEIPLKNKGFSVFWLPENPDIDPRLASHADLSVFLYRKTAILARYLKKETKLVNYLTNRGYKLEFSQQGQGVAYPNDVNLCAAIIGNRILHNNNYTDPAITMLQLDNIKVKQGYARCTALVVDENSIITADTGIAKAANDAGVDVLEAGNAGISLAGFDQGFIGGASFKAEDTIYFTGLIELHPNGYEIIKFIKERGLKICTLTGEALFDIGGAIYIG